MKRKNLVLLLIILSCGAMFAQNHADDIVGYYYSQDPFSGEGSQTYIYKTTNGTYQGRVCWVENKEKEHFINLVFLKNLTFNVKDNEWQNGEIKYPGKKGTYQMYMKFETDKKLKVRGYWKVSMLGKSMYWYKEDKQRQND